MREKILVNFTVNGTVAPTITKMLFYNVAAQIFSPIFSHTGLSKQPQLKLKCFQVCPRTIAFSNGRGTPPQSCAQINVKEERVASRLPDFDAECMALGV